MSWVQSVNLWSQHPDEAWFEMLSTWNDRHALKQAAGVKATGRDNTQPVLHFSLSWHEKDAPSREEMQKAALGALKALQARGVRVPGDLASGAHERGIVRAFTIVSIHCSTVVHVSARRAPLCPAPGTMMSRFGPPSRTSTRLE